MSDLPTIPLSDRIIAAISAISPGLDIDNNINVQDVLDHVMQLEYAAELGLESLSALGHGSPEIFHTTQSKCPHCRATYALERVVPKREVAP